MSQQFQFILIFFSVSLICSLRIEEDKTVVIISTNDIHGAAFPSQLYRSDTGEDYTQGGLQFMAQMIKTVQQEFKGNALYLDSGDQFQGGIQSSDKVSDGKIMNQFYNAVGLNAWAIGNHDFDSGPQFLNNYISNFDSSISLVAANIQSETGQSNPLPKQKASKIYLLENGIKIGVIGLSTLETPSTTDGFLKNKFPPFIFNDYLPVVLKESKQLRKAGANAILLLSHIGNKCDANQTYGIWRKNTKQQSNCDQTDEISKFLKELPSGTIDGILQGHRHYFSHHFINGVPVVGTVDRGLYFNILYLTFRKGILIQQIIEGPIPVCQKVFQKTITCNFMTKQSLSKAGQLTPWIFHGKIVVADLQVAQAQSNWLPMMSEFLQPLAKNEISLLNKTSDDSPNLLGNLFTNLLHSAFPNLDVVILSNGAFRTQWPAGQIVYSQLYNMFPFTDDFVTFDVTGEQLINLIKILQSGSKAFYAVSGLQETVGLSKEGKKNLIQVKFNNGSAINPESIYRVGTIDFLLKGGDDFKKVNETVMIPKNKKQQGDVRAFLKQQLINLGTITESYVSDGTSPRLIIIRQQS